MNGKEKELVQGFKLLYFHDKNKFVLINKRNAAI